MNKQRSRWLATALVGIGVITVPLVGNAASPAVCRRRRRDHRRRHVRRRPARAHRPGAQLDARRVPGDQRPVRRSHRDRHERSRELPGRPAARRVVRVQRGRHGVDVHHQGGPAVLRRRADPAEHVPALVGAGDRPDFAGDYSYLLNFIDGGAENLAGEADTITGVVADDEAMTLTVTMDAPYSNFPAVAGFQTFFPMPEAAVEAGDAYENERDDRQRSVHDRSRRAPTRRSSSSATRTGPATSTARPGRIGPSASCSASSPTPTPRTTPSKPARPTLAQHPAGRVPKRRGRTGAPRSTSRSSARTTSSSTRATRASAVTRTCCCARRSRMAIDREAINQSVYNGLRQISTGVTPPGIPGFAENLCDYCAYDPEAAQAAFDEWLAAGNEPDEPSRSSSTPTSATSRWWRSSSTTWAPSASRPRPTHVLAETYFSELADGRVRVLPGRLVRRLPDVRQLHVRPVPHGVDRRQQLRRRQQPGVRRARRRGQADHGSRRPGCAVPPGRADPAQRATSTSSRSTGTSATTPSTPRRSPNFTQNPLGLIPWEQLTVTK